MKKDTSETIKAKEELITISDKAKKDHVIFQNKDRFVIAKGDTIGDLKIPKRFLQTLRTEKII